MGRKLKPSQVPICREIETLYDWMKGITDAAPKTAAWEVLTYDIHRKLLDAYTTAKAGLYESDTEKKITYIDLVSRYIDDVEDDFRMLSRMSSYGNVHVVTINKQKVFAERMMKIGCNLEHWRKPYSSK